MFDPALLPTDEATFSEYGVEQLQALVGFYGSQVTTEFEGKTYSSPSLVDGDEIYTEWKLFKRALARETKAVIERKNLTKPPTLQEVKKEMESMNAYVDIFPEIFNQLNILLTLRVGTATVEWSFSLSRHIFEVELVMLHVT